jgi:ArsR family transcriptional regulator, arsenate/arsenite/antimonite-responsive transcriptional repressor
MSARTTTAPKTLTTREFELVAKALSDPRRVALLETIGSANEFPCHRLCEQFPVSKGTISHHMKELLRAGLITARREGQYLHYEVRRDTIEAYTHELVRRLGHPGSPVA